MSGYRAQLLFGESEELFALFPELRTSPVSYGDTARRILRGYETSVLAS